MKQILKQSDRGQSLVLLLLLMFVFLIILALVIDGGNSYFQRRNAQNAADAGALAGARDYCEFKDVPRAKGVASNYVVQNEAGLFEEITINESQGTVNVKTEINFPTFFGNVIGLPDITSVAQAEAGCEQPCIGEGVLPVVWICKPDGVGTPPGAVECSELAIDNDRLRRYLNKSPDPNKGDVCQTVILKGKEFILCKELAIVMDNIDIDNLQCKSVGGLIDCDFDGDGDDDYVSAENRGWADLDGDGAFQCDPDNNNGNEGVPELEHWITEGYDCPFSIHTWVGDQSAPPVSLFKAVEERRKDKPLVVLPIFDTSCTDNPEFSSPPCTWHTGPRPPDGDGDLVHIFNNKNSNYYHIERFSAFYITCVQTKNGTCPGADAFYTANESFFKGGQDPIKGNDYNAIEGYFVKGYVPDLKGSCGYDPDMDVFSVYMNK